MKRTKKPEIVLGSVELIETNIGLDGDTRTRVTEIRVTTRNDGKTLPFGFPRKVCYSV